MIRFSKRHGYARPAPPRDVREEAPEPLRALLRRYLIENYGALGAYRMLCDRVGKIPDPDIWSGNGAVPALDHILGRLEWFEVFDLLEEAGASTGEVNKVFVQTGLAYEMIDHDRIDLWDPEGEAFQTSGVEHEAEEVLTGQYSAIKEQYVRALAAVHGRPANLEKAVSESVGALEAVVHIISGKKDFGPGVDAIFATSPGWSRALGESLKKLYGYASQVPGARHGRHQESNLEFEEALYVVRACGVAISYLTSTHR